MTGEQETNLGHVGEELFDVIEIQVGARELGLDKIPDPLEGSSKGDIGANDSIARSASGRTNKVAFGEDEYLHM